MAKPATQETGAPRPGRGRRGATARAATALAARSAAGLAAASLVLAGCSLDLPPKPKPTPSAARAGELPSVRLADAPALLVQCAIRQAGLRPGNQSWMQGLNVRISTATADSFTAWFRSHDAPGPYPQTFVIDGHRTHYLAFGATWLHKNGQWVPAHTARDDPQAQRTSIYAWSLWAAAQDRLPPLVCGTSVTASALQDQVFGPVTNLW
jgi:hypothetical protein